MALGVLHHGRRMIEAHRPRVQQRAGEGRRVVRLQIRRGVGEEREARGVGVVDYEVVGQEVVVLLNPEIVCLPDSDLLDASHPVPVDLGCGQVGRQRPRRCDVVSLLERSKTAPAVDGEKGMFSGRRYFATEHSAEAVDHPLSARARLEHAPRT